MKGISTGNVCAVEFEHGSVSTSTFRSRKEMVQHFLCEYSLAGYNGSREHLEALEETRQLLFITIERVRKEVESEETL